jgi:hypothetical protein
MFPQYDHAYLGHSKERGPGSRRDDYLAGGQDVNSAIFVFANAGKLLGRGLKLY